MVVKKSFAQMLSVLEIYQITILINSEFVSAQGRSHTSRLIFSVLTQTEEKNRKFSLNFVPILSLAAFSEL